MHVYVLYGVYLLAWAGSVRRQAPSLHVSHDGGLLPCVLQREGAQRVGRAQPLLPSRGPELVYTVRQYAPHLCRMLLVLLVLLSVGAAGCCS